VKLSKKKKEKRKPLSNLQLEKEGEKGEDFVKRDEGRGA